MTRRMLITLGLFVLLQACGDDSSTNDTSNAGDVSADALIDASGSDTGVRDQGVTDQGAGDQSLDDVGSLDVGDDTTGNDAGVADIGTEDVADDAVADTGHEDVADQGGGDAAVDTSEDVASDTLVSDATDTLAEEEAVPITGTIDVHVQDYGEPLANRLIVFSDHTGAVVATQMTDESGDASAEVSENAMVTAVLPWESGVGLRTLGGAQPGDSIVWGDDSSTSNNTTYDISATLPGTYDGASRYAVASGCGGSAVNDPVVARSVTVRQYCMFGDLQTHLIATAYDADNELIAYSLASDVTVSVDSTTDVDFVAWSSDMETVTFNLTNAPDGASTVSVDGWYVVDGVRFGTGWHGPHPSPVEIVNPAQTQISYEYPPDFFDAITYNVQVGHGDSEDQPSTSHSDTSALGATIALDLTADFLPAFESVTSSVVEDYPEVSWTTSADISGADLVILQVGWQTEGGSYGNWEAYLPADTTAPFRFPVLPESALEHLPTGTLMSYRSGIGAIGAEYIVDYDFYRNEFHPEFPDGSPDGATLMSTIGNFGW